MANATCLVNGNTLPTTGPTGLNVSAGSTVTISLLNPAGVVGSWNISCTNYDGYNSNGLPATINAGLTINQTTYVATFTAPAMQGVAGSALQFTSIVNQGRSDQNTVTFGIFVLNSDGSRFFFGGESFESNATVGCAYDLNLLMATINDDAVTLLGDVTGTTNNSKVVGLLSHLLPSLSTGYLNWTGSSWALTSGGTLFTPGSDLSGNSTSTTTNQYVSSLSYSSAAAGGTIAINGTGTTLQFAKNNTAPSLSQAAQTTDAATNNLTLQAQGPWASASTNKSPGNIVLNTPAPVAGGNTGFSVFESGGTAYGALGLYNNTAGEGALWLGVSTFTGANWSIFNSGGNTTQFNAGTDIYFDIGGSAELHLSTSGLVPYTDVSIPIGLSTNRWTTVYSQTGMLAGTSTTGAGTTMTVEAEQGLAVGSGTNNNGANLILSSGPVGTGGSGGSSGNLQLNIGGTNNLTLTSGALNWASALTAVSLGQTSTSTAPGANFTISSQSTSQNSANAGNLVLQSGTSSTGTAGNITFNIGSTQELTLVDTTLSWAVGINGPIINQTTTTVNGATGNNLLIHAQTASTGSSTGGNLNLSSGSGQTAGNVNLQAGGSSALTVGQNTITLGANVANSSTVLQVSGTTNLTLTSALLTWATGITTPKISQANNTTNSATATSFTIQAANATGTTAVGGNLVCTSGSGTATDGYLLLQNGGTTVMSIGPNGILGPTSTKTGNYTINSGSTPDDIILCNQSAGITITLPVPAAGACYTIKDISGNAVTNNITIARHGSESIDGVAGSATIASNYGALTLVSNGTNWFSISKF